MHDDIGAMTQWLDQVRRRHGVVHNQWHSRVVCDGGQAGQIQDVVLRVGHRLAVERLGIRADRGAPLPQVVGIVDERHLDAELRQRVVEQVVSAAVQSRTRHDVITGAGDIENGEGFRRLTRGQQQCRHTAFEGGDPLLDRVLGGVHDPGVDIAGLGQPEQCCRVVGVAEGVGRGLVDRQRTGVGGAVGNLADVDLFGLEAPVLRRVGLLDGVGHVLCSKGFRWDGSGRARAADAAPGCLVRGAIRPRSRSLATPR